MWDINSKIMYLKFGELYTSDVLAKTADYIGYYNDCSGFVWSPDNTQIVYQNNVTDDIYILTLADKTIKRMTQEDEYSLNPSWSSDSKKLYYGRYNQIIEINIINNERKILYTGISSYIFFPLITRKHGVIFFSERKLLSYVPENNTLRDFQFISPSDLPEYIGRDEYSSDNYFNYDFFKINAAISHSEDRLLLNSQLITLSEKTRRLINSEPMYSVSWAPFDDYVIYTRFHQGKKTLYIKDMNETLPFNDLDIPILEDVDYCAWSNML